ncbi:hypothetical protein Pdw03_1893 [Penicillium digitatum]|uniref:Uncharacterized protein n=1 Tax=Penicillium digitatum TaxID=36651 RepID=A0A7T6XT81_PENDI|nr:hypothetical protein Pdw03_1893 [Penicillium digitatum]
MLWWRFHSDLNFFSFNYDVLMTLVDRTIIARSSTLTNPHPRAALAHAAQGRLGFHPRAVTLFVASFWFSARYPS